MGPIFKFLNSLRSLAKSKNITIEEAYKFAQQEFGEVSDLLKLQINKIFKNVEAPSIKKPSKPEGKVIETVFEPGVDKRGKRVEESESQLMNRLEQGIKSLKAPQNISTGLTRTLAREILMKKGIDLGKGMDPIEIFRGKFGEEILGDVANLADELVEMEAMGRTPKKIEDILKQEGFLDLKMPKEPPRGYSDEELASIQKEIDQEDVLKKFDPEDREPNATGGRVGFDDGGLGSLPAGLQMDTTTSNPIPENAPNMAADEIAKVIMGTGFLPEEDNELGYPEGMEKPMSSKLFIFEQYVIPQRKKMMENFGLTLKEADDLIRQEMEKYRTNKATGGRVGYAYGSGLKLVQLLQKAGKSLKQAIKEAVDNINPTGDKKLDADMAVDDMLETYSIDKDAVDGYDILNAYDEAYKTIANPKTMSEVETLEAMGANITAKTLELVEKYPGLNSELARKIASDSDPQRQAEVISTIEQAFELMKQGKSSDEVLDIMKQMTDRTKQAGGGLSYLSGF